MDEFVDFVESKKKLLRGELAFFYFSITGAKLKGSRSLCSVPTDTVNNSKTGKRKTLTLFSLSYTTAAVLALKTHNSAAAVCAGVISPHHRVSCLLERGLCVRLVVV